MPVMLNTILQSAGISPEDVRLLRHKDSNSDKGRSIYELWRDDLPSFDLYQSIQSFKNRKKLASKYWASFVVTPSQETLFTGIYRVDSCKELEKDSTRPHMEGVDKAGTVDKYILTLQPELKDLFGRLIIAWGDGERAWAQRADKQDKTVVELRKEFKEPDFPGYLKFIKRLLEMNTLPQSWISVFKSSRGIYLLTCPKTKEQYVGSASGADGFWGRWQDYIKTGHGGNVKLKNRELSDYQISILEVAGSSSTVEDILKMEVLWKDKLQSREMGLNRN